MTIKDPYSLLSLEQLQSWQLENGAVLCYLCVPQYC